MSESCNRVSKDPPSHTDRQARQADRPTRYQGRQRPGKAPSRFNTALKHSIPCPTGGVTAREDGADGFKLPNGDKVSSV